MGGSSGNSKTTQTSSPWSSQVPYLKYGMNEAARLYQAQGPMYYPGSTVAGFSPEQNQAFGMGTQRALNGNASMKQSEALNSDFMSGKYLNSDPYRDQVFQNVQSHVMPAVNSQFMASGRYGSDSHAGQMTTDLTNAYAPYASQQYQQGLDRMQGAAANAPMYAANDYTDLAALEAIGQQKQGLGQQELNDAVNRWQYYQQLPYDKLGQFLNNIGGNYGGTVVGKTPSNQPSGWQTAAGIGSSLLGMFL